MMHAASLTDDALTVELARLAGRERELTAALIVHLAEFDARRLYEGAGYPSMFAYCRSVLRLSEDVAYNRIKAARATRMYPEIVAMLADGTLNSTSVRLLAPHLTVDNHSVLLAEAAGMGKEDVLLLLARWFPQPDVAPSVRKLPSRALDTSAAVCASIAPSPAAVSSSPLPSPSPNEPAPTGAPSRPALIRPLAPERYEVRFTAGAETRALMKEAQDLLGHAVPTGDLAVVFHRALVALVAELKRRKFGATARPRPGRTPKCASGDTPAAVRREVCARDANRCAFVSRNGRRCEETRFLEFHHVVPRAAGGEATVDNIQLRCRAHNGHEVDLYFGPGKRWVKGRGRATRDSVTRPGTGDPCPLPSG